MSRQDFMKGCKGQNPVLLARGKTAGAAGGKLFTDELAAGKGRYLNAEKFMTQDLGWGKTQEQNAQLAERVAALADREHKNSLLLDAMKQGREL